MPPHRHMAISDVQDELSYFDEDGPDRSELREALHQELQHLTTCEQDSLAAIYHISDESCRDVAARHQKGLSTIYYIAKRATNRLRVSLEKYR